MSLSETAIFRKTDKGQHELRTRACGLNPRARQVLILIDGRRSARELARMIPEHELIACLTLLEGEAFVEPVELSQAAPPAPQIESLPALRARVVRALLDAAGPHGDEIAGALERCESAEELRALIAPAASVVEAVRGRQASARFLERIAPP